MIWVGTSGFQYPEWKGKFYPEKLSPRKMLAFYSERFNSTEINYTFKRFPTEKILTNWAAEAPEKFQFTLKAPQEITHFRRLRDCELTIRSFAGVAQVLGRKLGAILFQLDPRFACDLPLLREFLAIFPPGLKGAFEFRHPSWFNDEVFAALRAANCAFCVGDSEKIHPPIIHTAQYAYFRLRDEGYRREDIRRWASEVRQASTIASDVYVYFKHEKTGTGPEFASQLNEFLNVPSP
jgi:uncharacterized protein YecE (DUF72 family)